MAREAGFKLSFEKQLSKMRLSKIKSNKLTIKDRRVLKAVMEGKPVGKAMQEAGLSPSNSTRWLRQPKIREAIDETLKEKGLDFPSLCETAKCIVERAKEGKGVNYDKNFLNLMNIILKIQGYYTPTKIEQKRMSIHAEVDISKLMSPEERILCHERALALARREQEQEG